MYSPKIRAELVPRIYREAKRLDIHMTTWMNAILETALNRLEQSEEKEGRKGDDDRTDREEKRQGRERVTDNLS